MIIALELRPIFRGKYSTFQLHTDAIPVYTCDNLCQKLEDVFPNSVKGAESVVSTLGTAWKCPDDLLIS